MTCESQTIYIIRCEAKNCHEFVRSRGSSEEAARKHLARCLPGWLWSERHGDRCPEHGGK